MFEIIILPPHKNVVNRVPKDLPIDPSPVLNRRNVLKTFVVAKRTYATDTRSESVKPPLVPKATQQKKL